MLQANNTWNGINEGLNDCLIWFGELIFKY